MMALIAQEGIRATIVIAVHRRKICRSLCRFGNFSCELV